MEVVLGNICDTWHQGASAAEESRFGTVRNNKIVKWWSGHPLYPLAAVAAECKWTGTVAKKHQNQQDLTQMADAAV